MWCGRMWCGQMWCVAAVSLSLAVTVSPRAVEAQRRTEGAIPELSGARQITPSLQPSPSLGFAVNDTTVVKTSRRAEHAKVGAVVGVVMGGILGGVVANGLNDLGDDMDPGESFGSVLVGIVGGALIFGLIGAVVGALVP